MNSKIFDFSEYDQFNSVMVNEIHIYGAFGRITDTYYQIISVHVFGVDLTKHFDTETPFNEDNEELSNHLKEVTENLK